MKSPSHPDRIWIETEHAIAFADAESIVDGHVIVAPRKHVSTIHQLSIPEQKAIWKLVAEVRERLLSGLKPDSFAIRFQRRAGHRVDRTGPVLDFRATPCAQQYTTESATAPLH